MDHLEAASELSAPTAAARAPWPVAARRVVRTARQALDCRREILRDSERDGSSPTRRAFRLRDASWRMGTHLQLEVCVQGPIPDEPCVVVSNHMSYLDPLAIGQVLPLSAVAKSEIAKWPALGRALEELGIVFVERGNARSGAITLRKAMRILRAGVPVLVFPEGTTTFGDDVLPFSRGAFGVARLMRVPVVPAALRYESTEACWVGSASLVPHAMKLHRQNEVRVALTFGPRLEAMAFPDATALAEVTRQHIRRLVLP